MTPVNEITTVDNRKVDISVTSGVELGGGTSFENHLSVFSA
jgi:hypothetical protein